MGLTYPLWTKITALIGAVVLVVNTLALLTCMAFFKAHYAHDHIAFVWVYFVAALVLAVSLFGAERAIEEDLTKKD